jgi:hypothetical protein
LSHLTKPNVLFIREANQLKIRSSLYVLCALVIASGQSTAFGQATGSNSFSDAQGTLGNVPGTPTGADGMNYQTPTTTADGTAVQNYQMPAQGSGLGSSKNIPLTSGGLPAASTALMASPNLLNMVGLPSIPGLPVTGGTYAFGSTQIPMWSGLGGVAGYGFSGNNYSVYTGIDSPSGGIVGGLLGGTIGGIFGGISGIASGHYGGILAPVGTGAVNANTTIDNGY